jgi:tetratricopeptide (TPR) repeat protein
VDAMRRQDYDLAITEFSEAIRLKPDYAEAYYNRGLAFDSKGEHDKAIADFGEAIRLKPDFGYAYDGRGVAEYLKGDYDKAIADENEAIRLDPNQARVYYNRGLACGRKGDVDNAFADFNEAIRLKSDFVEAYNSLAWLLAVCPDASVRNGGKAVAYAKKACELSEWKVPAILDTLAAAYAEVGNFDDAVKWETKCLESNPPKDALEKIRQRLSLYEQRKPYHEEKP